MKKAGPGRRSPRPDAHLRREIAAQTNFDCGSQTRSEMWSKPPASYKTVNQGSEPGCFQKDLGHETSRRCREGATQMLASSCLLTKELLIDETESSRRSKSGPIRQGRDRTAEHESCWSAARAQPIARPVVFARAPACGLEALCLRIHCADSDSVYGAVSNVSPRSILESSPLRRVAQGFQDQGRIRHQARGDRVLVIAVAIDGSR